MGDMLNQALGFLGGLLWGAFETISGFFLQFFPDADMGVVSTIEDWSNVMSGGTLPFNVFYFIDIPVVSVFIGVALACAAAQLVLVMVAKVLSLVDMLVEKIPVIE